MAADVREEGRPPSGGPLGSRWAALALAGLAVVLSLTTWFSATAAAPELVASLAPGQGASALSSWLTNAVQAGFVVGALASSVLSIADVVRLTKLLAAASLAAAAANGILLLELGVGWAIASRFLTGAALALVYPPSLKFIATWFVAGRGLAMGAMVGALTLGSATPHLVRAVGGGVDWRLVIAVSSIASVAAALIFAFALREGPNRFPRTQVDLRQVGRILRDRPVMLANLGYFGHMWELYAMWSWFLAYASAAGGAALIGANASALTFAVVAAGAPGCVLAGRLADRIGRCATTSIAMAVSGGAAILIGFTFDGPFWLFAVVALIWGFAVVADSAQFSAAVTELSDPTRVGSALAFQMGVGFAITIFTIWLIPVVADALGSWRWSFLILAPGPVVGVAAMLALRARPEAVKLAGGRR